jgi:CRP-like cAMP-binding protein
LQNNKTPARIECRACPLSKLDEFRNFTDAELAFVSDFKTGELNSDAGATLIVEGTYSPHLYTVLDGWGFRYKILEDGRRQILNYVVPGDMIGLQGAVLDEMQHSVETLTPMKLCVFERERLFSLFERHPALGFDLTWIAAHEESILDEHLLSVGRRTALERASYLLAFLYERGKVSGLLPGRSTYIPVTQQHISDTLGLSIVHTNKTLRKVIDKKLIRWLDKGCEILDPQGLQAVANWRPDKPRPRPFI